MICLVLSRINDMATDILDMVQQAASGSSEFPVPVDVLNRKELRTLFLPLICWLRLVLKFELQQTAFESIEIDGEFAHGFDRQKKSSKAENRTGLVLLVITRNEWADVTKRLMRPPDEGSASWSNAMELAFDPEKTRKPAAIACMRASEGGHMKSHMR